ncbi:sugar kinase [Streptomyces albicerus]|uniref:sugar kinase n=1 Tax=Streptomyces albicerus TaxID=2569859 RepID=UPI0021F1826E|nr:sugar kinase [Streptomyces albicerus]
MDVVDVLDAVDVVTLGESMVTFLPSRPGRLADVPSFERAIGGAESNVACGLAAAGHSAKWVSRIGADGFGQHLVERIAAHGVDTSAVQVDPARPTGIYFRTAGERALTPGARGVGKSFMAAADGGSPVEAAVTAETTGAAEMVKTAETLAEVVYYRTGSAASAMSPANMPGNEIRSGRVLHLSGITAALSDDCLALLRDLTAPRPGRPLISFDVNYRVGLWRDPAQAGATLLALARGSDLVFVGTDEAEAAWGVTGGPAAIRAALPEPRVLVVKDGGRGATVFERAACAPGPDTVTHVPALRVDVVAPVGAGDAFAAGFLSATLRGLPVRDRLRHGHLMAAAALTVPGDLGEPPSRDHADRLAALDDDAWGTLRLGPGWTQAADRVVDRAQEEVRTP